jgi:hypothetical protein
MKSQMRTLICATLGASLLIGCSAKIQTDDYGGKSGAGDGTKISVKIEAEEQYNLANEILAVRIENINFDIYATCDEGDTNSISVANYTLGTELDHTLDAGCTNPKTRLANIVFNYFTIDQNTATDTPTGGSFPDVADWTVNGELWSPAGNANVLVMRHNGVGAAANPPQYAVYTIRERTVEGNNSGQVVEILPDNVTAEIVTQPNIWCSGVTASVTGETLKATFIDSEAGRPAGDALTIAVSNPVLPGVAALTKYELTADASIAYNFNGIASSDVPGSYSFTMTLTPDGGALNADESCIAHISFDITAADADLQLP